MSARGFRYEYLTLVRICETFDNKGLVRISLISCYMLVERRDGAWHVFAPVSVLVALTRMRLFGEALTWVGYWTIPN